MSLDVRTPMGLMFLLAGALLTAFGLVTRGTSIYAPCQGINANLWWGLILLAFGAFMFLSGRKGQLLAEKDHQLAGTRLRKY
jgi:hypothetical protein